MTIKILYTETYQLFYLKCAINELLESYNEQTNEKYSNILINTDHYNCKNFINNIELPLIYPQYIKNYLSNKCKEKLYEYNFIGLITPKREWIMKYNNNNNVIINTNKGRDNSKKYVIDEEYYDIICKSKFTFTPTGDCPWSYRFFEAIMCLSIPIFDKYTDDINMKNYFYYYDTDNHIYDKDKALENYNKFINSNHFLNNMNSIIQ